MPAGHATNEGQMLISCILARSLRASPHTLPSPISSSGNTGNTAEVHNYYFVAIIFSIKHATVVFLAGRSPSQCKPKSRASSPVRHAKHRAGTAFCSAQCHKSAALSLRSTPPVIREYRTLTNIILQFPERNCTPPTRGRRSFLEDASGTTDL